MATWGLTWKKKKNWIYFFVALAVTAGVGCGIKNSNSDETIALTPTTDCMNYGYGYNGQCNYPYQQNPGFSQYPYNKMACINMGRMVFANAPMALALFTIQPWVWVAWAMLLWMLGLYPINLTTGITQPILGWMWIPPSTNPIQELSQQAQLDVLIMWS